MKIVSSKRQSQATKTIISSFKIRLTKVIRDEVKDLSLLKCSQTYFQYWAYSLIHCNICLWCSFLHWLFPSRKWWSKIIYDASLAGGLIKANNALALRTPDLYANNKAKLSQNNLIQIAILAKLNCNTAIFTMPQCLRNLVWRGAKRWQH